MTRVLGGGTLIFVFVAVLYYVLWYACLSRPQTEGFLYSSASSAAKSLKYLTFCVFFVEIIADAALLLFFQKWL